MPYADYDADVAEAAMITDAAAAIDACYAIDADDAADVIFDAYAIACQERVTLLSRDALIIMLISRVADYCLLRQPLAAAKIMMLLSFAIML